MSAKWEIGKTYNGYHEDNYFVFEVTGRRDHAVRVKVVYTDNEKDLRLGEDWFHADSRFARNGIWRESLTAVNFAKALDDLSLMLKNEDLFKHFNKTDKGVVKHEVK